MCNWWPVVYMVSLCVLSCAYIVCVRRLEKGVCQDSQDVLACDRRGVASQTVDSVRHTHDHPHTCCSKCRLAPSSAADEHLAHSANVKHARVHKNFIVDVQKCQVMS